MEEILNNYFNTDQALVKGVLTVQFLAEQLIEKAKEKLSITNLTESEIAYELGFEHSQSFSKLLKIKTKFSPLEFRQSFN